LHKCGYLGGLALLEFYGTSCPWWRWLIIVTTGFEPQCASPFRKRVKAPKYPDPHFVLPILLLLVLVRSTSGDQHFCEIVTLCRPPPHQDWRRARATGNASLVMIKTWGPSWGKQLPGERPRETAETRHTGHQPSRFVRRKGAALLSGAEEQTARAISAYPRCVCLLALQIRSTNLTPGYVPRSVCAWGFKKKPSGLLGLLA
jgi:hypothetical protein